MNKTLLIILGVVAAGAAAFWYLRQNSPTKAAPAKAPTPADDSTALYLQAGTSLFSDILDRIR